MCIETHLRCLKSIKKRTKEKDTACTIYKVDKVCVWFSLTIKHYKKVKLLISTNTLLRNLFFPIKRMEEKFHMLFVYFWFQDFVILCNGIFCSNTLIYDYFKLGILSFTKNLVILICLAFLLLFSTYLFIYFCYLIIIYSLLNKISRQNVPRQFSMLQMLRLVMKILLSS